MSPYYIKGIMFIDGVLQVVIGDCNNRDWQLVTSFCADELKCMWDNKNETKEEDDKNKV
jgi:hypothetical protein